MFATIAVTVILMQATDASADPANLDGRGWAIRCAMASQVAKEDSELKAAIARERDDEDFALTLDAEAARYSGIYEKAMAAPHDVPPGPERFALANQFRYWATVLSDEEMGNVLGACEVALAPAVAVGQ